MVPGCDSRPDSGVTGLLQTVFTPFYFFLFFYLLLLRTKRCQCGRSRDRERLWFSSYLIASLRFSIRLACVNNRAPVAHLSH